MLIPIKSVISYVCKLLRANTKKSIFKDKSFEITQLKKQKEKAMKKSEESLRELRDIEEKTNICIKAVPRDKRGGKGRNLKKYQHLSISSLPSCHPSICK